MNKTRTINRHRRAAAIAILLGTVLTWAWIFRVIAKAVRP